MTMAVQPAAPDGHARVDKLLKSPAVMLAIQGRLGLLAGFHFISRCAQIERFVRQKRFRMSLVDLTADIVSAYVSNNLVS
ncbi:hypothetical protein, partial [Mesorhizobium sp.]|uniref:hypothetical protein n=1 Tax=Mesorhizobium sp. TaxID=1871066 RepID=UPI002603EFBE